MDDYKNIKEDTPEKKVPYIQDDLHILNAKRTYDEYQELSLAKSKNALLEEQQLNTIFNTHLTSILADERDHKREMNAAKLKLYLYDTGHLYKVDPREAVSLKEILTDPEVKSAIDSLIIEALKTALADLKPQ